MTPIPPSLLMGGGPPVNPPSQPTLSAIPVDGTQGPGPGLSAAIPQLVFNVEQQIKTLARLLPNQSEELDDIVTALRDVMSRALQRATEPDAEPNRRMPPGSFEANP